ncbi:MAG: sterol desaturase family protein [Verrucomicrobiota bacterium]
MSDWPPEAIRGVGSVTLLLLLLAWESCAPFFVSFVRARGERVRHGLRNLALGLVNGVLNAMVCVALWWWAADWAETNRFGLLHWANLPAWAQVAGAFVLMDLWMYGWHRLNHRVPWLWRFHRVHHSDPRMDVTTASRFHAGEMVISCVLRAPVIVLAGMSLWALAWYEAAMFAVVQLHHANISLPGWLDRALRLVIVTPFVHKVHHSNWQPETDSNYSSLFSFWDRIFGTFRLRTDARTLQFGLDELSAEQHQTLAGLLKTPFLREAPRADDEAAKLSGSRTGAP